MELVGGNIGVLMTVKLPTAIPTLQAVVRDYAESKAMMTPLTAP